MGLEMIIGAVSGLFSVVSGIQGMQQQKKANEEAKKAAAEQAKLEQMRRQDEARKQVREQRMAYATTVANSEAYGTAGSTTGQAATQSVASQSNYNNAYLANTGAISDKILEHQTKANEYNYKADMYANMGSTVSQLPGVVGNVMKFFNTPDTPTATTGRNSTIYTTTYSNS